MDTNLSAWIAAGGPSMEDPHAQRDRAQLHAFRESRRGTKHETIRERLAHLVRPAASSPAPVCCPA